MPVKVDFLHFRLDINITGYQSSSAPKSASRATRKNSAGRSTISQNDNSMDKSNLLW